MQPSKLEQALAESLNVQANQILDYAHRDNGYTVVLTDFRKFTNVQPTYTIQTTTADIPDNLYVIYTNPKNHTRADLRDLAEYLQIPNARKMNKMPLVRAINQWKQAQPEPISVEQAHDALFDEEEKGRKERDNASELGRLTSLP